jgi:F0F1-type ATP synthase assembly protein I
MPWTLIIIALIVLICAFFLVRRIYKCKPDKSEPTSQTPADGTQEAAEADEGE